MVEFYWLFWMGKRRKSKSNKQQQVVEPDEKESGLLQFQALPISTIENYEPGKIINLNLKLKKLKDYSKPPEDADEYLRRVHYESSKLQKTVTSTKEIIHTEFHQEFTFDLEIYEKPKNENFQVNKEWSQDVIDQFKNLNQVKTKKF